MKTRLKNFEKDQRKRDRKNVQLSLQNDEMSTQRSEKRFSVQKQRYYTVPQELKIHKPTRSLWQSQRHRPQSVGHRCDVIDIILGCRAYKQRQKHEAKFVKKLGYKKILVIYWRSITAQTRLKFMYFDRRNSLHGEYFNKTIKILLQRSTSKYSPSKYSMLSSKLR